MDFSGFANALLVMLNEMSPYILLGFFIAGLLHAYVRPEMMTRHLAGNGWKPVVKAAMIGIPLPLCSCGVLPTAVSLRRNGASDASTTSFLIATPQTGVDSIAATYSLLGPAFAITRPIAALVGAVAGGLAVGTFAPTGPSKAAASNLAAPQCDCDSAENRGKLPRFVEALRYGFVDMIASVGKWLVIGLVIAALITVFVPDTLFLSVAEYPVLAMIAVVIVAIPMYVCATGSIPIAMALMLKGLTPGAAFVLLMAGPAANFASILVLRKDLGTKATAIYVGSVVATAIVIGIIIDYLLPTAWFEPLRTAHAMCCHQSLSVFDTVCSAVLVILLIYALIFRRHNHHHDSDKKPATMTQTFKIKGMMCPHCQATVTKGLRSLVGVEAVTVDLKRGEAQVTGNVEPKAVIDAIHSMGYDYEP